jgi:hypothetical protein
VAISAEQQIGSLKTRQLLSFLASVKSEVSRGSWLALSLALAGCDNKNGATVAATQPTLVKVSLVRLVSISIWRYNL